MENEIENFLKIESSGYGDGSGSGDSYGSGSGYGSGDSLESFDNKKIYYIDGVPTIIHSIHRNIARVEILMLDFTLQKGFVIKGQNNFAHGETIEKAIQALQAKIFENMDTEQAIEEFKKHFAVQNKKYKASEFYAWHHILTGSCEMGRKAFAKNHEIDLDKDKFTIREFIDLTKNDYGGEIIKELEVSIYDK